MADGRYRALRRRLALTIMLVSYTPLLAVTVIAGIRYDAHYRAKVRDHLQELVQKHEQHIDGYLDEKLAGVLVLADILEQSGIRDEKQLEELHQILLARHGSDFVDLGLVDPDGILRVYAGPFRLGEADYSQAEWFGEVKLHKVHVSDVFLGLRGVPHFIIAVAFDAGGEEWILRTTLDFVSFNELVQDIHLGDTGQAYIINGLGEFQTTPQVDCSAEIPFLLELFGRQPALGPRKIGDGGPGTTRGSVMVTTGDNPSTGRETIFVTTPVKFGQWTLVFRQDVADAYSDLFRSRNLALLVLLVGGAAIAAMAITLPGRLVRRIEQADRDSTLMNEQIIEAGKLASVGELAAGIAHEINNPVAIMLQEAGWIGDLLDEGLEHGDNLAETRRALDQIDVQGARCRDITHNLLRFARKVEPHAAVHVQINDLLEEIVELSEQRVRFANVTIETELARDLPPISANTSEMQQVVLNLINNAIDAMEKEGGVLSITSREVNGWVEVAVRDTGMGIPSANLERIFDPFFTTKPVGKGTGLGLSVIYGIVDKFGGEIMVSSEVDHGTTFTIELPVAGDEEVQS